MPQETTVITRAAQLAQLAAREALFRSRGEGVTQQHLDETGGAHLLPGPGKSSPVDATSRALA